MATFKTKAERSHETVDKNRKRNLTVNKFPILKPLNT